LVDTQRLGRHRQSAPEGLSTTRHRAKAAAVIGATILLATILTTLTLYGPWRQAQAVHSVSHGRGLATTPGSYVGVYARGVPTSYAPVKAFTAATGINPGVVSYYSGWPEPFQTNFAATAASKGAVPLVQMNPTGISIAAIADGNYDSYLRAYAQAVRAYHDPVILSFGHEMNGYWYSWGYTHTSPDVFVAAWRHIVTVFQKQGAENATWLWTINTIHKQTGVPSPESWWPGSSYVTWVGIDGYYTDRTSIFASVFGPTIADVRALTRKPILIAETSVTPTAGQSAKIADLFAGVHIYGLLGFVWFDSFDKVDLRLTSPSAITAFRQGYETYRGSAS
jgi:mannan endo-1,4-beta-mannosidase